LDFAPLGQMLPALRLSSAQPSALRRFALLQPTQNPLNPQTMG